jgi:hypothetical protein
MSGQVQVACVAPKDLLGAEGYPENFAYPIAHSVASFRPERAIGFDPSRTHSHGSSADPRSWVGRLDLLVQHPQQRSKDPASL